MQSTVRIFIISLSLLLLLCGIGLHLWLIIYPYPLGYREGANCLTTNLIIQGINPFDLSQMPQHSNLYGIVYSLIVSPFALLAGNGLALHRLLNLVFVVLSLYVIAKSLKPSIADRWVVPYAMTIIYVNMLMTMGVEARPDFLGFFLYTSSIIIPRLSDFNCRGLGISLVFSILAFYTKIYFVIGFPVTILYVFLYINKRTAILYGLSWLFAFSLSIIIVHYYLNAYFLNVFFSMIGYSGTDQDYIYVLKQLFFYGIRNLGIAGVAGYVIISMLKRKPFRFGLLPFKSPLIITPPIDYYLFVFIITAVFFIVKFGHNKGSYLDYFIQISSVFLVIFALNHFASVKHPRSIKVLSIALLTGLVSLGYFFVSNKLIHAPGGGEWPKLKHYVESSKRVLNDPYSVSMLIEKDMIVYQSGHSYLNHSADIKRVFGKTPENLRQAYFQRLENHEQDMISKLKMQHFDLIISSEANEFIPYDDLIKYYHPIDTLEIETFFTQGRIDILVPNSNGNKELSE